VPVAFGVLTVDTVAQAEARLGKGGEAARAGLEMADIFSQVRAQTRAAG
jgi:6,7-dimethyl-8-ribityllumazine synthase